VPTTVNLIKIVNVHLLDIQFKSESVVLLKRMHTRQNPGTNNINFVLYKGSVLCDAVERYCRLTVLLCQ